jgi:hypothetical protein
MGTAKWLLLFLAVCCSVQFTVQEAESCSVPVFRYALERWKPDPYKGIFIYRGKLTKQDQALLQKLEAVTLNLEHPLNLRIRPVEIAALSEGKLKGLLKGPMPAKLPALAIWYPEQMGNAAPFWMQALTPAELKALADSPKRRQLTESLISGESIIWVFIPSGNSQKDERTKTLIRRELDKTLDTLAKSPLFVSTGSKGKKLAYSFPILTLSRSDPQEKFFLDMLLHSEPGLGEHKDEPMVFAVFGRGRMLGGIFGDSINEANIQKMVSYLAASCSCDVKAQHPGMDLLLSAFWDKVVMGELFADDDAPPSELTGVMPEPSKPAGPAAKKSEKPIQRSNVLTTYSVTLGSAIVVVVFAGVMLSRRRKEN